MLNSTTALQTTIKPTELERRMGRLLRGPDGHGDAVADGGAGGDGAADGAADGSGAGAGAGDGGDAGNADAGADQGDKGGDKAGEGNDGDGAGGDATSLVGQAAAKARAGKDKDGGDGGEGAADGDGDGEGDGADDDKDGAADVPEAYDLSGLKVTLKDDKGEDVEADLEIDTALLDLATPHLKEAKLSNDQAKALAPLVLGIKERALADQNAAYETMAAQWAKDVKADKQLGGKHWAATEHAMGRAFDRFGSPELDTLLEESRLGNHPAVVKFFAGVGKALGEDEGGHRASGTTEQRKSREEVLYPDDAPKS
jgi:hypothetical protein